MNGKRVTALSASLLLGAGLSIPGAQASAPTAHQAPVPRSVPAPIVLFPAYHFTKVKYVVQNQKVDASCPASGSFEDWFLVDTPSKFSRSCQDALMTLRYRKDSSLPFNKRFSDQKGVEFKFIDYGKTSSAPFYDAMYTALEDAGYVRDKSIVVAGYDARLTPDMGGFLKRTKRLIVRTYEANGNTAVHLVGHSNGPIYAQYLLSHTSADWKAKYIQGFTPLAGNFPGQGLLYPVIFTGLNLNDFTFPTTASAARTSAKMYLSAPSTYLSMADPSIFGDREVVMRDLSTGREYTPMDWRQLFKDAGLAKARSFAAHFIGSVPFAPSRYWPNVNVYAEKGSGLPTAVGAALPSLKVGQVVTANTEFFTRDGDSNQENITNNAVKAWSGMSCHFSLHNNRGVGHFDLPSDTHVLARLIRHAALPATGVKESTAIIGQSPRTRCPPCR